jgi:ACS family pantothenate transporter-like MFS transporter
MLEAFAFQVLQAPHSFIPLILTKPQGMFLLYLKHYADRFPRNAATTYPLGIQAVAMVSNILAGYYIDATQTHLPMGNLCGLLQLISASLLAVPNLSTGGTFFAYYNSATSYMVNPLSYGWASTILRRDGDDAVRAVVLYTMNLGSQVLYTFWGIVLYPATDAPYWRKGAVAMIVVCFVYFACLVWVENVSQLG